MVGISALSGCLGSSSGNGTRSIDIVTHLDSPEEQEALDGHASDFEDDTGHEVEVIYSGAGEVREVMSRRARAGEPPTLGLTSVSNLGGLVEDDVYADLSDEKADIEGEFGEVNESMWMPYQGEFLAVPIGVNGHNMTYRRDMVEEAGFTFPESTDDRLSFSWEEHAEWCQGINEGLGINGTGIAFGSTVKGTNDAIALLWNHGVDIWAGETPSEIELTLGQGQNRENAIQMLENVNELFSNGATGEAGWEWGDMLGSFSQEQIASLVYSVGRVMQSTRSNNPDHWDDVQPVAVPSFQGGSRSDGARVPSSVLASVALFKDSENPDIGREWIRHFVAHPGSIDITTAAAFHSWPVFPGRQQSDRYLQHEIVSQRPEVLEYQRQQQEIAQLRVITPQGGFNPWAVVAWNEGTLGNLIAYMVIEGYSPEEAVDAVVDELNANKPSTIN